MAAVNDERQGQSTRKIALVTGITGQVCSYCYSAVHITIRDVNKVINFNICSVTLLKFVATITKLF